MIAKAHKNLHSQQGSVLLVSLIILLVMTLLGVSTMQTSEVELKMANNAKERLEAFNAAERALVAGQEFLDDFSWDDDSSISRTATAGDPPTDCTPAASCFEDTCAGGLCWFGEYVTGEAQFSCSKIFWEDGARTVFPWMNCTMGTDCPESDIDVNLQPDLTSNSRILNVWETASRHMDEPATATTDPNIGNGRYIIEFKCFTSAVDVTDTDFIRFKCGPDNQDLLDGFIGNTEADFESLCAPFFEITAVGTSDQGVQVMLQSMYKIAPPTP